MKSLELTREGFDRLRRAVEELMEARRKSDERLTKLEEAVARSEERLTKLEEIVARGEERLTKLEQILAKSEERLAKLEQIVAGIEGRVSKLEETVLRLEEAVLRLEEVVRRNEERISSLERAVEELIRAHRSLELRIDALGARWGIGSESAFRNAIRGILEGVGFRVERYVRFDDEGRVFGRPDQIELDIVIRDGKVMAIEIKSSISRGDVAAFDRKIRFYEEREGRKVDRRIIISPFFEPGAEEMARRFGMEIYADADQLR